MTIVVASADDHFSFCHPGQKFTVIPASEPGSPKQSGSAQIVFCGDPRPEACGDDEGGWHAGMTIFIPVIPASEPGSPKQSGSAPIAFLGDPRPEACGDDGGIGMR